MKRLNAHDPLRTSVRGFPGTGARVINVALPLALSWLMLSCHKGQGTAPAAPPGNSAGAPNAGAGGGGGDSNTGAGAPGGDASGTVATPGGGSGSAPPDVGGPPPPSTGGTGAAVIPYARNSLAPLYQLTPRAEYGRIAQAGVQMQDSDFTSNQVVASAAQKLDEIGASLNPPRQIITSAEDRDRAQGIPFRGNPSDVKMVTLDSGVQKLYVPLGGDVMTPGNEVAVVVNGTTTSRIKVGVRPQRVAVHPAGLVFVCNQYSNFISIIDPRTDQPLPAKGGAAEIPTQYFCADLAFVPKNPAAPDNDHQWLYVANRWRRSVLKYSADVIRDPTSNRPVAVLQSAAELAPDRPALAEITGVGSNPFRLALSQQQDALFVANNKGGDLARIELSSDRVTGTTKINAPSADVVNIADLLFVPTMMIDRGLLAADDVHPAQVLADPVVVTGLDGQQHTAHPGALFDGSRSYNFEDVRNGLMQLDFFLKQASQQVYYTDDVSPEPNYVKQQKVLAGSLPSAIARNAAGTSIFVALGGSALVQELSVNTASRPFTLTPARTFSTGARPFALALDEKNQRLYVANWGQETLDAFDLTTGNRLSSTDLGYANPTYPATNVERGELFYYDTRWSNNGRKSCASCHFDELDIDGFGYSNGAQAPTVLHQVKPNHNLATTDSYFWNGSFADGNYTSLAFFAQTRTNCEIVEFGMVEGPGSDPNIRIGDPNNTFTNGQDDQCRPQSAGPSALANQAQIDAVDKAEKQIAAQQIQAITGFDRETLSRFIDFYDVSELRLPPNPLRQLYDANQLDPGLMAKIKEGHDIFAGTCGTCHDPSSTRHPFTDGLNHGAAADWTRRFVDTYRTDPIVTQAIGSFPQTMLDALAPSTADHEVNIYLDPIEFFIPFCFDSSNCLEFDDPLTVRGTRTEEARRLSLLVSFNLADPDRGFIPGNVRGAPQINTPSLRGVWTQVGLLRMAEARSVREAVLGPGHAALRPGETGYAIDALGNMDVHGATSRLKPDQVDALYWFVQSIQ